MDQATSKQRTMFKKAVGWFNRYTSLPLTVISILMAVYFYYVPREYAEISYSSSTVKVVSQHEVGPSIKVTSATGEPIDADVYVTDLVVWNSGNQTIEKEQIRSPLTINIDNEVLQIEKSKENAQSAHFELENVPDGSNMRYLKWNFFDPNYGVRIAIVTAGNQPPNTDLKGELYGVNVVPEIYAAPMRGNRFMVLFPIFIIQPFAGMLLYINRSNSRGIKLANEDPNAFAQGFVKRINREKPLFYAIIIFLFLLSLIMSWLIWATSVPSMPADL